MTKETNDQRLQGKANQFFGKTVAAAELHDSDSLSRDPLTPAERFRLLHDADLAEEDIFRRTVLGSIWTLFALEKGRSSTKDPEPQEQEQVPLPQDSLADWLWESFRKNPSAIFATRFDRFCRDDVAVIHLAQRLGKPAFPQTKVEMYPAGQSAWRQRLLDQKYQAICLVGRPCLFGQEAVDQLVSKQLRFSFPDTVPLETFSRDDFNPKTKNRIRERISISPFSYEDHYASEEDGQRYDFGLLQRYPIKVGDRRIVIVLCAGTSSLGTLAVADWACQYLWDTVHFENHQPIPCPKAITPESQMEALISVTAPLSNSEHAWQPSSVELQTLIVDRSVWCLEDQQWRLEQNRVMTILYQGDQPLSVLLDEKPTPHKSNSQAFRLLVAAALLAHENNGRIDVNKLVKTSKSWNKGEQLDAKQVRRGLSSIKSRCDLGDTLTIDANEIRLHAKVVKKQADLAEGKNGGA